MASLLDFVVGIVVEVKTVAEGYSSIVAVVADVVAARIFVDATD